MGYRGQSNSAVHRVLGFNVADPSLMPGIPHNFLSTTTQWCSPSSPPKKKHPKINTNEFLAEL